MLVRYVKIPSQTDRHFTRLPRIERLANSSVNYVYQCSLGGKSVVVKHARHSARHVRGLTLPIGRIAVEAAALKALSAASPSLVPMPLWFSKPLSLFITKRKRGKPLLDRLKSSNLTFAQAQSLGQACGRFHNTAREITSLRNLIQKNSTAHSKAMDLQFAAIRLMPGPDAVLQRLLSDGSESSQLIHGDMSANGQPWHPELVRLSLDCLMKETLTLNQFERDSSSTCLPRAVE